MSTASFLPEDYLAQKAERRTNVISLVLFGVVMVTVFGAFLVTNRQWSQVKQQQTSINERYQQAAQQIQDLAALEEQKKQMLDRAELASALVETVPRSIMLAELINHMPPRLSLLTLELQSEKIASAAPPKKNEAETGKLNKAMRAPTKEEAAEEVKKIEPPKYRISLILTGVAPGDLDVSKYLTSLGAHDLIHDVRLDYIEDTEIEDRVLRQFSIAMTLDSAADVRDIDLEVIPRGLGDPMDDQLIYSSPTNGGVATAPDDPEGD
jgi:hypothetical protein